MTYEVQAQSLEWQQIDWSYVPYLDEPRVDAFFYVPFGRVVSVPQFSKDQALEHPKSMSIDDLLDLYRENGFDTDVILENPLTHRGPTAVCPIGFPLNLPRTREFSELKKFRRWVCRIHVDINRDREKKLFSIPHIEVDPVFHWTEHLRLQGREVYGQTAVKVLKMLLS